MLIAIKFILTSSFNSCILRSGTKLPGAWETERNHLSQSRQTVKDVYRKPLKTSVFRGNSESAMF